MPTSWNFDSEYIQSCNCDYGCPCNFNGLPTHGGCEALVGYHVTKGTFGDTPLAGVKFAMGLWWPKAIHEGNGAARLYIDPSASPPQKAAIQEIASGKHGGAVFEIFAKTFSKVFPTHSAKIDWHWGGYDARFHVEGIGEVRSSHIKNPVTGEKFEGSIILPGGINWRKSDVTSVDWSLQDKEAGWDMQYRNRAGFVTTLRFTEKGPV